MFKHFCFKKFSYCHHNTFLITSIELGVVLKFFDNLSLTVLTKCVLTKKCLILEKKVFKTLVVSCSVGTTSPFSIWVILSVDTVLSERNGFIVFQKVLLSVTFLYVIYCNNIFSSFL